MTKSAKITDCQGTLFKTKLCCAKMKQQLFYRVHDLVFTLGQMVHHMGLSNTLMCILFPMIHLSTFPEAYFSGLSDTLKCLDGLQMAVCAGQVSTWLEIST